MPDKNRSRRKFVIIAVIAAVLVAAAASWYFLRGDNASSQPPGPENGSSDTINYDPPSEAEKKDSSDRKDEIIKEQNQTPPPGAEKRVANPVIVDAGQYGGSIEVRAFAPGTVDSDGKCAYTFTLGTATVNKETAATADASTTRCANLQVARSEFPSAGTWRLTLTYDSSKAHGSTTREIEVQ
jgi:hypothetical protein